MESHDQSFRWSLDAGDSLSSENLQTDPSFETAQRVGYSALTHVNSVQPRTIAARHGNPVPNYLSSTQDMSQQMQALAAVQRPNPKNLHKALNHSSRDLLDNNMSGSARNRMAMCPGDGPPDETARNAAEVSAKNSKVKSFTESANPSRLKEFQAPESGGSDSQKHVQSVAQSQTLIVKKLDTLLGRGTTTSPEALEEFFGRFGKIVFLSVQQQAKRQNQQELIATVKFNNLESASSALKFLHSQGACAYYFLQTKRPARKQVKDQAVDNNLVNQNAPANNTQMVEPPVQDPANSKTFSPEEYPTNPENPEDRGEDEQKQSPDTEETKKQDGRSLFGNFINQLQMTFNLFKLTPRKQSGKEEEKGEQPDGSDDQTFFMELSKLQEKQAADQLHTLSDQCISFEMASAMLSNLNAHRSDPGVSISYNEKIKPLRKSEGLMTHESAQKLQMSQSQPLSSTLFSQAALFSTEATKQDAVANESAYFGGPQKQSIAVHNNYGHQPQGHHGHLEKQWLMHTQPLSGISGLSLASPQKTQSKRPQDNNFVVSLERILEGHDGRTTLMIRNIPNKYTQKMLLEKIDRLHAGKWDFFYLPIDLKNNCNVGYAFINFVDPVFIVPFYLDLNAKSWERFNSEKICEITYGRLQGQRELVEHFSHSADTRKVKPLVCQRDYTYLKQEANALRLQLHAKSVAQNQFAY